jgi:hypothetical protein
MIVWEMLSRTIPYEGLTKTQIISLVGHEDAYPLPEPHSDNLLVQFYRMCTRRSAKERPSFQALLGLV